MEGAKNKGDQPRCSSEPGAVTSENGAKRAKKENVKEKKPACIRKQRIQRITFSNPPGAHPTIFKKRPVKKKKKRIATTGNFYAFMEWNLLSEST